MKKLNPNRLYPKGFLRKCRGWTDMAIDKWLGEPDMLRPNPKYPDGGMMKTYYGSRIERAEAIEDFKIWKAEIDRRRRERRRKRK